MDSWESICPKIDNVLFNIIMDKKQENLEIFSKIAHHSIPKWNDLPVISFVCEQNNAAIKAAQEITSYIVYKIDLFCKVEDDDIKK